MKKNIVWILVLVLVLFSCVSAYAVDYSSSPEEIAKLQDLLVQGGILSSSDSSGNYDSATIGAIARFQEWVNENTGGSVLSVTGIADEQTINYLILAANTGVYPAKKNEPQLEQVQPAPSVSPVIFDIVDSESQDTLSIQESMQKLGLLDISEMSGIYDSATATAVLRFQSWTNDVLGEGRLPTDGICDYQTRLILDACVESHMKQKHAEQNQEDASAYGNVNTPIIETISNAYQVQDAHYFLDSIATFNWTSDEDVLYYTVVLFEDGKIYSLGNTSDTSKTIALDQLQPGLYKLLVGAVPVGSTEDAAVWGEMTFGIPTEAAKLGISAPLSVQENVPAGSGILKPDSAAVTEADATTFISPAVSSAPVPALIDSDISDQDRCIVTLAPTPASPAPAATPEPEVTTQSDFQFFIPSAVDTPTSIDFDNPDEDFSIVTQATAPASPAETYQPVALFTGVEALDITELQLKLIECGLLNGEPSGIYDVSTYSAVKEMQRRFGLEASGIINQEFLSLFDQ